jgi:predicted enzyme related to lactoylglutathione lyase
MTGEIVHLELPSRNFERSAAFYEKLFGWRADAAQAGGHLLFEIPGAGEDGKGGIKGSWVREALAQSPGPLPFVAVDDVDRTLAEAERQGGRILVKRLTLAGQGEFGLFADLDGNVIAVLARVAGSGERLATARTTGEPKGGAATAATAATVAVGGSPKPPAKAAGKPGAKETAKDPGKKAAAASVSGAAPATRPAATAAKASPKNGPARKR